MPMFLVLPHVADLHPLNSIKVITNFAIHSLDSSMGDDAHLLARVPVLGNTHETSSWRWETYVPAHKYRVLVRNAVISELVVELKDENNNHVEFNGIPWCIKLAISHVHTKNIKPLLNGFLNNASQARAPDGDTSDETRPSPRERATPTTRPQKAKRARRRKRKATRARKDSKEST